MVPTPASLTPAADLAAVPPIEQSNKKAIQIVLSALKPIIDLRGSIPLPFVTTFFMVALDEGKGVNAYARAFGVHRAAMSRYLRDIGDRARNGGPGLGLVTVKPHPSIPRRSQVRLTAKGRSIAKEIFVQLRETRGSEH
jgi:hypothetical protein